MTKILIKDRKREQGVYDSRIIFAIAIVIALSGALISRLAYLQILKQERYTTLSKQNQVALLPIQPKRGLIYDRNGVLLAENIPVFSLEIIPDNIKNLKAVISSLEKIINIRPQDVKEFYKILRQRRPFEPVPLKARLSQQEVAKFYVNQYRFPGVTIKANMMRYYPQGKITASVVGYIGRINAKELSRKKNNEYSATDYIGKTGVESYYEKQLHGDVGYQQVEVNASGQVIRVLKQIAPTPGETLYLTIDSKLQKSIEDAFGDEQGAVVAIQPDTGQVLALVSHPSFDPNTFVKGISEKQYRALQNSPTKPLFNRALRGIFPPGSTIKVFLALAGLSEKIITPDTTVYDPGWFQLANSQHTFLDWKPGGHGYVNVTKAIIVSCDTFFFTLGYKLGIQRIDDVMHAFGFGEQSGINLVGEHTGILASPEWKHYHISTRWYPGDTVNSSIGQGYMVSTPIQLADAVATIANRGKRYQPNILLKVKLGDGETFNQPPIPETPVVLNNPDAWDIVIHAMQQVITSDSPRGTGVRFGRTPPYTVAAKTGTAQIYHLKNGGRFNDADLPKKLRSHSLFIAFAPVKNAKIAIAVVAEHDPSFAAALARNVMDAYLQPESNQRTDTDDNQEGDDG